MSSALGSPRDLESMGTLAPYPSVIRELVWVVLGGLGSTCVRTCLSADGQVTFELVPRKYSVCKILQGTWICTRVWKVETVRAGGYWGAGKCGERSWEMGFVPGLEVMEAAVQNLGLMEKGWGTRLHWSILSCPAFSCSIIWATYVSFKYILLLLVEILRPSSGRQFQVVRYNLGNGRSIVGSCLLCYRHSACIVLGWGEQRNWEGVH